MLGSISIRNSTDRVVTVELRQVGPLFWKILEPNEYFTFDKIGLMWFTVNIYLGPVYFSKSDVALPIISKRRRSYQHIFIFFRCLKISTVCIGSVFQTLSLGSLDFSTKKSIEFKWKISILVHF